MDTPLAADSTAPQGIADRPVPAGEVGTPPGVDSIVALDIVGKRAPAVFDMSEVGEVVVGRFAGADMIHIAELAEAGNPPGPL